LAAPLSAMAFVGLGILWVRSYWRESDLQIPLRGSDIHLVAHHGGIDGASYPVWHGSASFAIRDEPLAWQGELCPDLGGIRGGGFRFGNDRGFRFWRIPIWFVLLLS